MNRKYYLVFCLVASSLMAVVEKEGVTFPDTVSHSVFSSGQELQLNGVGVRKATWFQVRVYVAGLYVKNKSQDAEILLKNSDYKKVQIHFLRDVGQDKIRQAWDDSIEKNCQTNCADIKKHAEKLKAFLTDMKQGQVMSYWFSPDGVIIEIGSKVSEKIGNAEFVKVLLSSWLGEKPVFPPLKEGFLGKS